MATLIDRLAQVAYEAYRAALPTPVLLWEDLTKKERQAWKAAVTAVAGQTGGTLTEAPSGRSLVLQLGDQRHTFRADFTVGREGRLTIDDDFASGQHARFLTVRGLWYVEDLDSTNGTTLNGRPILSVQLLKKRDKIRIGQTVMTVVSVLGLAPLACPDRRGEHPVGDRAVVGVLGEPRVELVPGPSEQAIVGEQAGGCRARDHRGVDHAPVRGRQLALRDQLPGVRGSILLIVVPLQRASAH